MVAHRVTYYSKTACGASDAENDQRREAEIEHLPRDAREFLLEIHRLQVLPQDADALERFDEVVERLVRVQQKIPNRSVVGVTASSGRLCP